MIKRSFLLILAVCLLTLSLGAVTSPASAASQVKTPVLGKEIVISGVDNEKHLPSVAYNSNHNEYLVVWHNEWAVGTRDIHAQRISAQGQLLGSEFIVYENPAKDSAQPSVAYDPVNDRYLVTFIYAASGSGASTDWDLYGRLIPWNGPSAGLTAFPIITWPTYQFNPRVVYAGGIQQEFMVVWNNTYSTGTPAAYVSGKRIRPNGSFPTSGADLTLSDLSVNYINPDVSYNLARNEYLVVWDKVIALSNDDIWGVRITGNALPLGGGPFAIAGWPDDEESPSVAACNLADQYLVTWHSDQGTGGTNSAIYGRYLGGDASLQGVYMVDDTTSPEREADVSCSQGGNQYLIAWQTMYVGGYYGVWARLAFPDESMKPPFGLVQPGNMADRLSPAVAGGKTNYLVAWEHERSGTSYVDIHGRLVIPNIVFLPFVRR